MMELEDISMFCCASIGHDISNVSLAATVPRADSFLNNMFFSSKKLNV